METLSKLLLMSAVIFTSACSWEVVPPTSKGKILTTAGYNSDILPPGKLTLWGRDELILIQTNTDMYKESIQILMADKITMGFDVRFRGRLEGNDAILNSMFDDIVPGDDSMVSFNEVYRVYGKMVVRRVAREIISKYTVDNVHENYERLSKEISAALAKDLQGTPIALSEVALGSLRYPKIVTDAINAAKERELAIKKEEAQAEIDLTKKRNEGLLAEANYQIEITKAKAIRDSNKIIGQGITPELLALRQLEVQEKMATNGAAVFMPYEAMKTTAGQMRVYAK